MIKVLIQTETLTEAFLKHDDTCRKAVDRCVESPHIQAWILASAIQSLVESGMEAKQIASSLASLPKIPVNHRLTQEALEAEEPFAQALELAAAHMFKIAIVLSPESSSEIRGVSFVSCREFLDRDEGGEVGNIGWMDLTLPIHSIFDRLDGWYMEIIQSTAFAGGNHVAAFEEEYAAYCGTRYAVGTGSGTEALLFCLLAVGVGGGDEVLTVPNTFIATAEAISQTGATPVFVDIEPESYNMDSDRIEEKITGRTKAILPVHLYGQVANMDAILSIAEKHGLTVLEDACQAHGALYGGKRTGSLGIAAAFSMYPGKNLGAFGEAGCIVTNDADIERKARLLRDHGQSKKYCHDIQGYNGRMDNLQAASLRAKLPFLDGWNARRRKAARLYRSLLQGVPQVLCPPIVGQESAHVFHLYVVLVPNPQKLHEHLKSRGISTAFHYPVPLHKQKAYARQAVKESYPVAEKCADMLLTLPLFPEITERQIARVCSEIRRFYD